MSSTEASLLEPRVFIELSNLVASRGIRTLVETGTGPMSSGMEAAKRLRLHGYTCDVFKPCALRAAELYPDFDVYHADSVGALKDFLPKISGPTFFWLDAHCPTDPECLPGDIFPAYEEMILITELKRGFQDDVIWVDDVSMIVDPENPVAQKWAAYLGSTGAIWHGEYGHSWAEYLDLFSDTHDWSLDTAEKILKFMPTSRSAP